MSDIESSAGAMVNDRYEIIRRIGAGGIGDVYEARDHQRNGETIALKVLAIRHDDDRTILTRFQREVELTRDLCHPHIIKIFEFTQSDNGAPFFTMEYVDGGSLSDRIQRAPGAPDLLNFNDVLVILHQVASALAHAHAKGVVHRDLKPDNILLSRNSGVKVADFGLARRMAVGQSLTNTGEAVGTPYYMAPEQIGGERVDGRADIYSLGIMAYEMATWVRPFQSKDYHTLAMAHLTQPLPPMSENKRSPYELPSWLEPFVNACSEKRPAARYQTMNQVVRALEKKLRGAGLIEGDFKKQPLIGRLISKMLRL